MDSRCAARIFGRPLADMQPADANCARGYLADLDCWCDDCREYRLGQATHAFDVAATRLAYDG
jgi:hypothetical protein